MTTDRREHRDQTGENAAATGHSANETAKRAAETGGVSATPRSVIDFSSWDDLELAAAYERNSRLLQVDGVDPLLLDMLGQLEVALRDRGIGPDDVVRDLYRRDERRTRRSTVGGLDRYGDTMPTATRTNEELLRRTFDALNERDREAFAEVHPADVAFHSPDGTRRGIETVTDHEWETFDAFPDLEYTVEDVVAADDQVAFRCTAAGTHEGAFQGVEPTGREVELPVMGLANAEDDALTEVWISYDALGLMQQLGALELTAD